MVPGEDDGFAVHDPFEGLDDDLSGEHLGQVAAGPGGQCLLDQLWPEVPAVDDHLRATVTDEVLEVEVLALNLTERVVENDIDVGHDWQRSAGLDHVDPFVREERGDSCDDHRVVVDDGQPETLHWCSMPRTVARTVTWWAPPAGLEPAT